MRSNDPQADRRPPGLARQIDQVCDRFEAALQGAVRPRIEQYLADAPELPAADLLGELLALELEYRIRRGERPSVAEYLARFPVHAAVIDTVFHRQPILQAATTALTGPVAATPAARAGPGGIVLTVEVGPHKGRTFAFAGHDMFLVGRSRHAHFQLADKDRYFSRTHFMIEVNPPSCRLTDMGSHNGTYVNGQRVQVVDLHDGDQIQAGHTLLRVAIPETAVEPSPPAEGTSSDDQLTLTTAGGPNLAEKLLEKAGMAAVQLPRAVTGPLAASRTDQADGSSTKAAAPTIRGYQLVRELGRGGMGVVYLALRKTDGSQVALKTIIPAAVPTPLQTQRFLREAHILCQLQHAHIVAFRDMGESGGRLFFAMDYVDGIDAAQLLKQHVRLPVRTAVRLISQLLLALEYAHAKGFVHRDIKPANLLIAQVENRKIVKLADFGLARVYQASRLSGLTLHGMVGGTLAFMPPEQLTHFREIKPAGDQYSAAATLYNLLTGELPYDFGKPGVQPFSLVLHEDPVPIGTRCPDIPKELAAVVHRALARDPTHRFLDARTLRQALQPFGQ